MPSRHPHYHWFHWPLRLQTPCASLFEILVLASIAHWQMQFTETTGAKLDADMDSLLQRCLGVEPRKLLSLSGEAEVLGIRKDRLSDIIVQAAAIGFVASRLWITSALSHFSLAIQQKHFKPIACLRFSRYDETSLLLRSLETAVATKTS